jgi:peptidoglycan/LPS O-acetylase OafA/YrhL
MCGPVHPGDGSGPTRRGHIGRTLAGSLATGLIAAILLTIASFIPPDENDLTGAVLCGFAVGWAMFAILSTGYTDQAQRWAAAPALVMGLGGLLLIAFGDSSREVLNWVWPPVLLALVIRMFARARRRLHSRSRFCCSTRCWRCWRLPASAGDMRPFAKRLMHTRTRCRVS